MKGLLISLVTFALCVLSTAVLSHIVRTEKHSRVFLPAFAGWSPVYFALFFLTPDNLGFLPAAWTCHARWLDATYGFVVYLLNCHSYLDFFFAFNGGFSMSVMLEILRTGPDGARTDALVAKYVRPDGFDKIYGWRLPRLEESGMITIDREAGTCALTGTGRKVARLALFLKRCLNLGEGG